MKFRIMRWKYGTERAVVQAEILKFEHCRWIVTGVFVATALLSGTAWSQTESTSPLAILQQAPTVRIEDPTPTPMLRQQPLQPRPQQPVPYRPPSGPAPYIEPAYPALTPYNGNSVTGNRQNVYPGSQPPQMMPPQMGAPGMAPPPGLPEPGAKVTPTPRILGPEDVGGQKEKKRGFVRGLINAIPFVGDDDEEEARFTPVPTETIEPPPPIREENFSDEQPIYRGYEPLPASPEPGTGAPLLLPPGSTPVTGGLPGDPTPSSPPIMTPTPRGGVGVGAGALGTPGIVNPQTEADTIDELDPSRPVLTVKREGEETSATVEAVAPGQTPAADETKQPEMSGSPEDGPVVLPRSKPLSPLDVQTSSVTIEEIAPRALSPEQTSPTPVSDLDKLNEPQASVGSGSISVEAVQPTSVPEDIVTSLTIEQSDLGMPNPTYEQNSVILGEFQAAVRKARAEDYDTAAQLFREYGFNHPSSGLAPRAFFLSIVFEKNRAKARESAEALKRLFPESNYVKQAEERRPDLNGQRDGAAIAQVTDAGIRGETPRQKIERLERELTAAVGDLSKEPTLRRQLGEAYLEIEENDRAWEVLSPAADMAAGTPEEGPVLVLLARAHMARGEVTRALSILDIVEQKYPTAIASNVKSAWSAGLAFEAGARYAKARAIYNEIRQKWPDAQEAKWAELRLRELAALSQ